MRYLPIFEHAVELEVPQIRYEVRSPSKLIIVRLVVALSVAPIFPGSTELVIQCVQVLW